MKYILALSIMSLVVLSCSKESISPTQGQVTATKLKNDISTKGAKITSIDVTTNNGLTHFSGTSYSITSDGFITVSDANGTIMTYNLGQLKSYQFYVSNSQLYSSNKVLDVLDLSF